MSCRHVVVVDMQTDVVEESLYARADSLVIGWLGNKRYQIEERISAACLRKGRVTR